MTYFYKSFVYALRGLKTVWNEERNFRIEILIAIFVALFAYFNRFSLIETTLLVVAIVMVIAGEIVNTTVEDLCNKIEPSHDVAIGKIKDMMAGFVLVNSIGASLVGLLVFLNHFF